MTGLADVDGFKICIQDYELPTTDVTWLNMSKHCICLDQQRHII